MNNKLKKKIYELGRASKLTVIGSTVYSVLESHKHTQTKTHQDSERVRAGYQQHPSRAVAGGSYHQVPSSHLGSHSLVSLCTRAGPNSTELEVGKHAEALSLHLGARHMRAGREDLPQTRQHWMTKSSRYIHQNCQSLKV